MVRGIKSNRFKLESSLFGGESFVPEHDGAFWKRFFEGLHESLLDSLLGAFFPVQVGGFPDYYERAIVFSYILLQLM